MPVAVLSPFVLTHPACVIDWRSGPDASILDLIRRGLVAVAKERPQACQSSS